jgi:hypothetical protein
MHLEARYSSRAGPANLVEAQALAQKELVRWVVAGVPMQVRLEAPLKEPELEVAEGWLAAQ